MMRVRLVSLHAYVSLPTKQSISELSSHAKPSIPACVAKLSDQVSVRIDPEWRDTLRQIEEAHRIPPPEFIRGLIAAGLEFSQGWFAFPVSVQPGEAYVQAVAETQSRYGVKPAADARAVGPAAAPGAGPAQS